MREAQSLLKASSRTVCFFASGFGSAVVSLQSLAYVRLVVTSINTFNDFSVKVSEMWLLDVRLRSIPLFWLDNTFKET